MALLCLGKNRVILVFIWEQFIYFFANSVLKYIYTLKMRKNKYMREFKKLYIKVAKN